MKGNSLPILLSFIILLLLSCVTPDPSGASIGGADTPVEVYPSEDRPDVSSSDAPPALDVAAAAPALTPELLVDSSVGLLTKGRIPVIHQGAPWGIIHDLDKNGYADYLLLTLHSDEGEFVDSGVLMDSRRLFQESLPYVDYGVAIFYQYPDGVIKRYTILLEDKLVLQDFRFQEIRRGRDFPFNLAVSFQTTEGTEEEWIILQGRGISRFTVEQTLSKNSLVGDIDGDDLMDVVVHQEGFEEGSGYETFITWYRWDGREFKVHDTTNVVRNLREFFKRVEETVLADGWYSCLSGCLDSEALAEFRSRGLENGELLNRFFKPLEDQGAPPPLIEIDPVGVVFPSILENPFTYQNLSQQKFSFILKIQDRSGDSFFYEGLLGMSLNPFTATQFIFLPLNSGRG